MKKLRIPTNLNVAQTKKVDSQIANSQVMMVIHLGLFVGLMAVNHFLGAEDVEVTDTPEPDPSE